MTLIARYIIALEERLFNYFSLNSTKKWTNLPTTISEYDNGIHSITYMREKYATKDDILIVYSHIKIAAKRTNKS